MKYTRTAVIILPEDVDRNDYVNDRLTRGVVDLFSQRTGVIRNVRVGMTCLPYIKFPRTPNEMGSEVTYTQLAGSNEFLVTDVLKEAEDIPDIREDSDMLGDRDCTISIDVKNRVISIFGKQIKTSMTGAGAVDAISIPDGDMIRTAMNHAITVMSSFMITLIKSETDKLTLRIDDTGLYYLDYNGNKINIDENKLELIGNKLVTIGDGNEVAMLGNVTKQLLSDFIDQVSAITTITAIGTMPIINKAQVEALKKNLDNILSTYLKIQ